MSEINPKIQAAALAESTDLSDLAASKDLHKTGPLRDVPRSSISTEPANSTDLASASISTANVNIMRVSQRSEIRKAVPGVPTSHSTGVELTNSRSRATGKSAAGATAGTGIFKNPFYRYDGGLLNKILALIGNILKAIERIFLRLLGARDISPLPNRSQPTQSKSESTSTDGQEQKQELERKKRKEVREAAELLVRRQ